MKVTVYKRKYINEDDGLKVFIDALLATRMKYLVSDLVYEGVPKEDIGKAVKHAMAIMEATGMVLEEHFKPVYTQLKGTVFKDFKMTQKGWFLVLLNLPPGSKFANRIQLSFCEILEGI
ncbi:hypothetical protein [Seonamhaeicola marinus]|uniref:Uncharacterized protein n=1 Tax=Seonamhaeicola marinus TaxID=1912246 RepID=A0A5D0IA04_9FLAO|nr:hypothetical protein [Seonamhaeicola marinus]TYA78592.1 hypothetical protein FUA24_09575 [Seonamhaeicola marinus]